MRLSVDSPVAVENEARCFQIHLEHPEYGIRKIMQDEKLRRAEADARREELVDETVQLEVMLRMLQARGNYTKADVREIVTSLTGFDENAVEMRIKNFGLAEGDGRRPIRPKLSAEEAAVIETALRGLQLPDLYAFLGEEFGPNSSSDALKEAVEKQKARVVRLDRVTAEFKVLSRIMGHVRTQLLDKDKRQRYDNYLADRRLRVLDTLIKLRAGDRKTITEDALNDIIRESGIPGVTAERVREYVEDWVSRTKGWTLANGLRR